MINILTYFVINIVTYLKTNDSNLNEIIIIIIRFQDINRRICILKQEIAANCEKYIRAKDTQLSLMIFSSEFKLVKPFVFLSFIFESTDRYNVFHMTHVTVMLL